MKNIWVLGSNGLVGEALKKNSSNTNDYSFHFLERKDFEIGNTNTVPFKEGDIVVDLVPSPFPREELNLTREEYHQRFTDKHLAFIELAIKSGLDKYIFLSSGGTIYGDNPNKVNFIETDQLNPVSFYGESKKIIEDFLIKITGTHHTNYTILRCSNIFNADAGSLKQTGLIGVYLNRFRNKQTIDVFGDEGISKDYIANSDVADAILSVLQKGNNEVFNIGTGKSYSITNIINAFEKSFNQKAVISYKASIRNDVKKFVLNSDKANGILNFKAKVDVIDWILSIN